MAKNTRNISAWFGLLSLSACLCMTSCSEADYDAYANLGEEEEIDYFPNGVPVTPVWGDVQNVTRAALPVESYDLYGYNTSTNAVITAGSVDGMATNTAYRFSNTNGVWDAMGKKLVDGEWKTATLTLPKNKDKTTKEYITANIHSVAPSFDVVDTVGLMTPPVCSFRYDFTAGASPTGHLYFANELGWYQARLKAENKQSLQVRFFHADAHVRVYVYLDMNDVTVKVNKVVLHNVPMNGTFTFSNEKDCSGEWTPIASNPKYTDVEFSYGDGSITLKAPKAKTNKTTGAVTYTSQQTALGDSAMVIMPFDPRNTYWNPAVTGLRAADAANQQYIELQCSIADKDGIYLWGAENNDGAWPMFESLYFQIPDAYLDDIWGVNTTKQVKIHFHSDYAYMSNGQLFEPHGGSSIQLADWLNFEFADDSADEGEGGEEEGEDPLVWEDDEEESDDLEF